VGHRERRLLLAVLVGIDSCGIERERHTTGFDGSGQKGAGRHGEIYNIR
jgi:hypothetical protein